MTCFTDEIKLKQKLDEYGVRYGERMNEYTFYVEFYDNKGDTIISRGLYSSPIGAVRDLARLVPEIKLPADDISMYLVYALPNNREMVAPAVQFSDIELDKSLYFQEKKVDIETENTDKE